MSAFIVEDKTIHRIVNWLKDYIKRERDSHLLGKIHDLDIWDYDDLSRKMFALNVDAVNQRYGEGEAENFRPLNFQPGPTHLYSKYQVYKSLQCWLYQCTEGNIPDHPLYKLFDIEVRIAIAEDIIKNRPEYEKAEWG